jgi:hypothetical protein
MKKSFILALLFAAYNLTTAQSQKDPFNIALHPISVDGLVGLQSYAVGQYNGKWLLIGGRLDGLHRRQPFAAFDPQGNNQNIIVVDPVEKKQWSASLSSLPTSIREHLSATNMQFHQENGYLYVMGGYGYNATSDRKITFSYLTSIDVEKVIDAVIKQQSITSYFRQISDQKFAVTGGQLKKIYDTYYLVGGNKFDGNYNPMGNPTYTQVYTNAIRKFKINDDGNTLSIEHEKEIYDAARFHKRDYNLVSQIFPNGAAGLTAFSGVFQPSVDLPFLDCVNVDSNGYHTDSSFQQYLNHYHCATIPIYSSLRNEMHSVFFGGIAQYYYKNGILTQDNNVPFVNTIARVTRNEQGEMSEHVLPITMPGYFGASAEFVPNLNIPIYENEVIQLDSLVGDSTLLGYIYGGIHSSAPNIFFTNTGGESTAASNIYAVWLKSSNTLSTHQFNELSRGSLNVQILPNPNNGQFGVHFELDRVEDVFIELRDIQGKLIEQILLPALTMGEHTYKQHSSLTLEPGTYLVTVKTTSEICSQHMIIH